MPAALGSREELRAEILNGMTLDILCRLSVNMDGDQWEELSSTEIRTRVL